VQQRDHLGGHAPHGLALRSLDDHAAVELDQRGRQGEHPVEVGVAGAEVVQRQQKALGLELAHLRFEIDMVIDRGLQDFDDDLVGRQARPAAHLLQALRGRHRVAAGKNRGIHVQEQPVRLPGKARKAASVQFAGSHVQGVLFFHRLAAGEEFGGRNGRSVGRAAAQQGLVTHDAAMGQAEDRLEVGRERNRHERARPVHGPPAFADLGARETADGAWCMGVVVG